jgi:hypothetical protein
MQLANPLLEVVRAADRLTCKQCQRAGAIVAVHDHTGVYLVHDEWLFRDTKLRVDYSCGCHAMLVEPRKWNAAHPEYDTRRPK